MRALRKIGGRLVEIETANVEGIGWVAVGVVQRGLRHEVGMSFMARGADCAEAASRLELEAASCLD